MSKIYSINKSTIEDIGNAIRKQKNSSVSIPVKNLAAEISNIDSTKTEIISKIRDGSITEVTAGLLANTTQISAGVFYGDKSLTKVTIPDNIEAINILAFYGCYALKELTLGNNLKMIGSSAFSNCTALPNVSIPDSVETIGSNAFHTCITFTEIKIPDSVTEIGEYAFTDCTNLKKVELSKNIKRINQGTFWNCSSLNNLVIPEGVTHIDYSGIRHCPNLTNITLPNSLVKIGSFAFYDSDGLYTITIPQNVTKIGEYAFYDCNKLEEVVTGGALTQVDKGAFQYCNSLRLVTVGENVKEIGEYALANCTSLEEVRVLATTPPKLSWTTCYGSSETFVIYVHPNSLKEYKNAEVWSYKANYIFADPNIPNGTIPKESYRYNGAKLNTWFFSSEIKASGIITEASLMNDQNTDFLEALGKSFTRIHITTDSNPQHPPKISFYNGDVLVLSYNTNHYNPADLGAGSDMLVIRITEDVLVSEWQLTLFNYLFI